MIEVDGSKKSGSGTILRLSIALAAVLGKPLRIYNIRENRPQPGLRPQHLEAVLTATRLCNGAIKGARLNSRELWFEPGDVKGGEFEAEIGTAGSISALLVTVLPICLLAETTVSLHVVKGGTDVRHSPPINYTRYVLLPTLRCMGLNARLTIHKYGYYPRGMGEVTMTVEPCQSLKPLRLESLGEGRTIEGVSVCTFLAERKVAERQAKAAENYIEQMGYRAEISVINDRSNPLQKGSSIVVWARTETGAILGADAIGELGKASEAVGREAAEKLYVEISTEATVDLHLADMIIPYLALAKAKSVFLTRAISDHLETNIWLSERLLGVKFSVQKIDGLYRVERVN